MCGGPERTGCLACSRDKDVAHGLPDGRGRKEGRGGVGAERTCSRGSGRKAAGKGGEEDSEPWGESTSDSQGSSPAPPPLYPSLPLLVASSVV